MLWLETEVAKYIKNDLSYGNFKKITISNPDHPEEKATVMIDPYLPPHELIILGGGHIAVPLAKIGKILGYQVTVVMTAGFCHAAAFSRGGSYNMLRF